MGLKADVSTADANMEVFTRRPVGMSTLDLLGCSSSDGVTAWNDPAIPAKVRREMHQLVKADLVESLRPQQIDRPRMNNFSTLGLPKDPPPLGEQTTKSKHKFVHGTPTQRRLIGGKLIRTSDLESTLSSSVSAPELYRGITREVKSLKNQPEIEQDALDVALKSSTSPEENPKTPPQREMSPAEKERVALRQQENLLQSELLRVSRKLSRKYQKQLNPRKNLTTCKIHTLAQKWEEHGQQEEDARVNHERYNLYVAGRFSTQMELDYYQRKIEPREPATDKHRRPTMHSKYGNALARNKCSLRGPF
ncbi:hypothetical protein F441_20086 [Phytophthora nicotianae CJ01A1]|uniref:Uncharacterized protein n=5 Tax=Phytophthora nicotianae TaxID=4792 RepID=W2PHW5_PHYN3|nr:hypothetical protein PPTG_18133 [Phytophthora nicotianae INRA-310]ETI33097.1 hypothetical protein F443_20206 [Phytophthora nicotianae P1569]ETK73426.1 hypothetical protein L915_19653 [Phytophthora nicotianae]ETP02906.1 hypothetical protein F441_20086 [Phytophthora nicotianae CJ01A1]ETL26856.1 hypothetical protein L916_19541 [Phytophthora nicotianae]ETM33342.1 hypothetical protein L914_19424 [Phytophthora nicotianae]